MDVIQQMANANAEICLHAILRHLCLYVTILEKKQPSVDAGFL